MQRYVIIVAGGIGTRMKSDRPKQFIELKGEPIIVKTIRVFLAFDPHIKIIISVHKNYKSYLENVLEKFNLKQADIQITLGGETRFGSVKNGLVLIPEQQAIVAIHDAARPFVSIQTITNCFELAAIKGNAVPSISVNESMRKISNNVNCSVNRNEFKIIQTPQCFEVSLLKKAFLQEYSSRYTDDATVVESIGVNIHLAEGNEENIKITSPHDLIIANAILNT